MKMRKHRRKIKIRRKIREKKMRKLKSGNASEVVDIINLVI